MIHYSVVWLSITAVFVYMNLMFILALLLKKNDVVDVAWGIGFILIAVMNLLISGWNFRVLLSSVLVIIWGLRLAVYIFMRNRGQQEDFRYAQWKKDWGSHWLIRSYLQVFLLQGFFMLLIAYPLFVYSGFQSSPAGSWDLIGAIVWIIGFFWEAVGDFQMRRFKQDPANRGKIMDKGLWKYTRHPNYFGESTMWWGIFVITLNYQYGWTAILSPIVITLLLLKVSGIPLLEKKYSTNPAYREYIQKTSSFIPWFPRKQNHLG